VWASADPILAKYLSGQSNEGVYRSSNMALYSHAGNNPILLKDFDGNEWFRTITDAEANTRAYLKVTYGSKGRYETQYTNDPAADLKGNNAIAGGKSHPIKQWSNPGANEKGIRPVLQSNVQIPGEGSTYGARRATKKQPNRIHHGLDFSATTGAKDVHGSTVVATGAGQIGLSRDSGPGTGNSVRVDFSSDSFDQNFHLENRSVEVGQWVTMGQRIGTVGSTGMTDTNQYHLHYQTTRNGKEVDPNTTFKRPVPARD
jgi:murein DD-endopeptidase MepM/ murein hydrolase activator NlpD